MKGDDMKYILFIVLLVAAIIIAGCASESKENLSPEITSAVGTTSATPTIPTQKMVEITTMVTIKTIPTPTKAPSKPVASPVTVNGASGNIMRFHTDAPGIVKFTINYAGGTLDENREGCSRDDRASLTLAGAAIDTSLYNGVATETYTGIATFNLISPGSYSLTTRGCDNWKVVIDNA